MLPQNVDLLIHIHNLEKEDAELETQLIEIRRQKVPLEERWELQRRNIGTPFLSGQRDMLSFEIGALIHKEFVIKGRREKIRDDLSFLRAGSFADREQLVRAAQYEEYRHSREIPAHVEKKPRTKSQRIRKNHPDPREQTMLQALAEGWKGPGWATRLLELGIWPRQKWVQQGCPQNYPAAYRDAYWRQRINDEKSKIQRKFSTRRKTTTRQ